MIKHVLILLSLLTLSSVNAQRDSVKRIRFSGIQLELGTNFYPEFKNQDQKDYWKLGTGDANLDVDLSTYKNQDSYSYNIFGGLPALKFYADLNTTKKLKKEIYIGLKYGQEFDGGAYYSKTSYDTIGTYTDAGTGSKLFKLLSHESTYNYGIHSQKLMVPVGINITTNKQKIFWFTAGLELAPALNFGYTFRSAHNDSYGELLLNAGDTINSQYNYTRNFLNRTWTGESKTTKLGGIGYSISAAMPFAIYLHPFRKLNFVKHINLMASVTPGYLFTHSKYSGSVSTFNLLFATGLRYNW